MEEKEYLQKIDELHQWLKEEPIGRIVNGRFQAPCGGYIYANKARELFSLALQLRDTYHPDYIGITEHEIEDILGDEIKLVESSYKKTLKSKVSKKDKEFYETCLYGANSVIDRSLYTLFEYIKDEKFYAEKQ